MGAPLMSSAEDLNKQAGAALRMYQLWRFRFSMALNAHSWDFSGILMDFDGFSWTFMGF